MDELVNLVAQRTGLSPDQSRAAAESVIGFLKERLPAPIAAQMDSLIAGDGAGRQAGRDGAIGMMGEVGGLGSVAKGLGGMFGEKP